MNISIIIFLLLLQTKHLVVDFLLQTMAQVRGKGIYGNWAGITHSLYHGLYTMVFAMLFNPSLALVIGLIDAITHYHIDWTKMNYGNRDMMSPRFWHHLGYDQYAHQVVYLVLAYITFA